MDGFKPTPDEVRTILALRAITDDEQREAIIQTILILAAKSPQRNKVARIAAVFEFKRPA